MKEYHKIQTVFLRNPADNFKTLLIDQWSLPEFELLQNIEWVWTEKIDGTNIRVMFDGKTVRFGGKTDNAQIPAFLLSILQDKFTLELMNHIFPPIPDELTEVCLYGEGYGAKIQKAGGNYLHNSVDFILFDIKIGKWWLRYEDVVRIAEQLSIKVVPIVNIGKLSDAIKLVSKGFTSLIAENTYYISEGLVMKPKIDLFSRNGGRIITKIKYRDFN